MPILVWIAIAVLAASFGVTTGFFTVCTARRILESGVRLSSSRRIMVNFWFYLGAVCDFVYNLTVGVIRFRDLPHEPTYSQRIQRYVDGPEGWRRDKAIGEARMLNAGWPNHIRLPGE